MKNKAKIEQAIKDLMENGGVHILETLIEVISTDDPKTALAALRHWKDKIERIKFLHKNKGNRYWDIIADLGKDWDYSKPADQMYEEAAELYAQEKISALRPKKILLLDEDLQKGVAHLEGHVINVHDFKISEELIRTAEYIVYHSFQHRSSTVLKRRL